MEFQKIYKSIFKFVFVFSVIASMMTENAFAAKKPDEEAKNKQAANKSQSPDVKEPPKKVTGPDAANALDSSRPTRYVHQWIPFPKAQGINLVTQEPQMISTKKGRVTVLFFIASWCELCQNLSDNFKSFTTKYSQLPIDFYFLFAHDTLDDAKGFMLEHSLNDGVLIGFETLKNFNNPDLPTIYIADRDGWILTRLIKPGPKELDSLRKHLDLLTAF